MKQNEHFERTNLTNEPLDHALCARCGILWECFDVCVGDKLRCDNCAKEFNAGVWYGPQESNWMGRLCRGYLKPKCPKCECQDTIKGKDTVDTHVRQCLRCDSTWLVYN